MTDIERQENDILENLKERAKNNVKYGTLTIKFTIHKGNMTYKFYKELYEREKKKMQDIMPIDILK